MILKTNSRILEFNFHYWGVVGLKSEVERLLAGGLDVNYQDEAGWTALHKAVYINRVSIVRLLLAGQTGD